MKTVVTTDIHLTDESTITARSYDSGSRMHWEALSIDDAATIYINTREQAERLFDEVSDLTMRWRDHDPKHFRLDAEVAPTDETASHPDHDHLRAKHLDNWTCDHCD